MKNSLLILIAVFILLDARAQSQGGVEQYYYMQEKTPVIFVPIVHYQTKKNWYTEARYNYEDLNTFSIYGGKIFTKKNKVSYSFIPIIGGVMGKYKGGSVGLNLNVEYKKLFFSSQSQYTFSAVDKANNFFYSWSELTYDASDWIYFGLAVQHTHLYNTALKLGEKGVVIGLSFGKWIFPIYAFSPLENSRYFVVGINKTLQ